MRGSVHIFFSAALPGEIFSVEVRVFPEQAHDAAVLDPRAPDRMVQITEHLCPAVGGYKIIEQTSARIEGKNIDSGADSIPDECRGHFPTHSLRHGAHIKRHDHMFRLSAVDPRENVIRERPRDLCHIAVDPAGIMNTAFVARFACAVLVNAENGVRGTPFVDIAVCILERIAGKRFSVKCGRFAFYSAGCNA